MKYKLISFGRMNVTLGLPDVPDGSIIYLHSHDSSFVPEAAGRAAIAVISGVDWNRELTPWQAAPVFHGSEPFGGEGERYLAQLTGELMPEIESYIGFVPEYRIIAGYSLAGLFALWACCIDSVFSRAASISGSLWYDGFVEWLESFGELRIPERVYLSLGDREHRSTDARMSQVQVRTEQIAALLSERGSKVIYKLNRGGHFTDIGNRINCSLSDICSN